jgi:hypothetical protein
MARLTKNGANGASFHNSIWCLSLVILARLSWATAFISHIRIALLPNVGAEKSFLLATKRGIQENIRKREAKRDKPFDQDRRTMFDETASTALASIIPVASLAPSAYAYVDFDVADPVTTSAASSPRVVSIGAEWSATSGLNSLTEQNQFVGFDRTAYQAMRDDPSRTPLFKRAIEERLASAPGSPESQIVLDLGTGPFALFAIIAAEAGAGTVYAIEANPEAAKVARETIRKAGFSDIITVLEGFSTDVTLPNNEKADLVIAEIVGSIATEEGAYATILDAHSRLVKEPSNASSWIPSRIQTYAAPASYGLHNLFQPPAFDWTKLEGEPVRFNCRDKALQLVSNPLLVEDISFADIKARNRSQKKSLCFTVDGSRIKSNGQELFDEFKRGKLPQKEAVSLAVASAHSISGIAFWPRLILDAKGEVVVNSRSFPDGGHQRSHWQTVLPIMSGNYPVENLKDGDTVEITVDFDTPGSVTKPPQYRVKGQVNVA